MLLSQIQATKAVEYLIAIGFLFAVILLWRFLKSSPEGKDSS